MWLSSRGGDGCGFGVSVVGAVAEHGVEDVAAAAGQADQGGVVLLASSGPCAAKFVEQRLQLRFDVGSLDATRPGDTPGSWIRLGALVMPGLVTTAP